MSITATTKDQPRRRLPTIWSMSGPGNPAWKLPDWECGEDRERPARAPPPLFVVLGGELNGVDRVVVHEGRPRGWRRTPPDILGPPHVRASTFSPRRTCAARRTQVTAGLRLVARPRPRPPRPRIRTGHRPSPGISSPVPRCPEDHGWGRGPAARQGRERRGDPTAVSPNAIRTNVP